MTCLLLALGRLCTRVAPRKNRYTPCCQPGRRYSAWRANAHSRVAGVTDGCVWYQQKRRLKQRLASGHAPSPYSSSMQCRPESRLPRTMMILMPFRRGCSFSVSSSSLAYPTGSEARKNPISSVIQFNVQEIAATSGHADERCPSGCKFADRVQTGRVGARGGGESAKNSSASPPSF